MAGSSWWQDVGDKLWNIGKLSLPGVALFELLRGLIGDWWTGLMDSLHGKFNAVLSTLSIDLAPPAGFSTWIAKINAIVPLSEAWGYFLIYLGIASVVLGIKWARNLIPGMT